mmetsp:Transcript_11367/g.39640  ORF Transcript_11367/g.39640 Transcript_11367/m.39640 type:complete len:351 (-) Transcript_11367:98-1150(-)|eukprot:CAMPEP_0203815232 /NCGR_PEP_ID=MMETSP0115-20131106/8975_1 /ASSEMBLY_ACC=CAM_ASM_000227 /TAXON_ID=33651 /ORGANISM="Bicosoecid sp, Strain ms1" /LENGTH=350 /DNA_ID=CAMNT_0050724127 /DNA_START=95 /DNA_END=1147 /DNA_ORIENTATION=+
MGQACAGGGGGHPRVVVIGLPGAGKSSLLAALAAAGGSESAGAAESGAKASLGSRGAAQVAPMRADTGGIATVVETVVRVPPVSAGAGVSESSAGSSVTGGWKTVVCVDVPGSPRHRELWPELAAEADAVVFVVDAFDRMVVDRARDLLHELFHHHVPDTVRLCVYLNKADKAGAMTQEGAMRHFELGLFSDKRTTLRRTKAGNEVGPLREWHAIEGSATHGEGVGELLQWMADPARVGGSISTRIEPAAAERHEHITRVRSDGGNVLRPRSTITGTTVVKGTDGKHYDLSGPPPDAGMSLEKARGLVGHHEDYLGAPPTKRGPSSVGSESLTGEAASTATGAQSSRAES